MSEGVIEDKTVEFIENSSKEELEKVYEKVKCKLDAANSKVDKISIWMAVVLIVFYLLRSSSIDKIELSFFSISNIDLCLIALPPLFVFLIFYLTIFNNHKGELESFLKILSGKIYFDEIDYKQSPLNVPQLIYLTIPFTFWGGIFKKVGCLGIILWLPVLIIPFAFIYFMYDMLCMLICEYWCEYFVAKISVVITCWILLYLVYYYIFLARDAKKLLKYMKKTT